MKLILFIFLVFSPYYVPYFIGSIPFGLILGKIFGAGDIRKIGSGNIGATNVLRTGRRWLALATLLCDMAKGALAVYFGMALSFSTLPRDFIVADKVLTYDPAIFYVAGIAAILGHIFPIWLKFKGGKGVATAIGTLLAIAPALAACLIIIWLITFFISRISSLSALAAFAITTCGAFLCSFIITDIRINIAYYILVVTLLIFATHRSNIARLIKGTEPKFTSKKE